MSKEIEMKDIKRQVRNCELVGLRRKPKEFSNETPLSLPVNASRLACHVVNKLAFIFHLIEHNSWDYLIFSATKARKSP